ncbi:CRISPR-associated helicase/endonuclease Cas3 [Dactylosporangium maewongense]|uniref:CRISPR-associated helicase/endonuclease Cas3 n=1 Tax=Dactylosporangium maewongense TaxID=634393 RepID=A0ABP4NNC6_9ACTN
MKEATVPGSFDELVRRATTTVAGEGYGPYPYQRRLAEEGLPDLLRAPTGSGKTLAAALPWLYRRRYHPDGEVRRLTPRRLAMVLPQRSLVEQTRMVIADWLDNLGLAGEVGLHVLMGGASTDERSWLLDPASDAILIGTQDMVLSRLLLRGYAEPHARRPMSFGLLHASTQFVFDEVQLMGPALPTSLQLAGLRGVLGTAAPCQSMWMSATVDPGDLRTVDYPGPERVIELGPDDRAGGLRRRLEATRTVQRADVPTDAKRYAAGLAQLLMTEHRPGTRTIVVLNTVARANEVYVALSRLGAVAEVVLLHSRFRPGERAVQAAQALAEPGEAGTIVIATQVLEAGVDVSSRVLITESAPWSSIVQRAGRCNRAGEYDDALLLWLQPPKGRGSHLPYDETDLAHAEAALTDLENAAVTTTALQERPVAEQRPVHPVLRRRDLIDLFDTAPDLSGNDLDVSRWIRDADTITVGVAWRALPDGPADDAAFPAREELCQVPVAELRAVVSTRAVWVFDQTAGAWQRARPGDIRPGGVVLLNAADGGYLPDQGWAPASRTPVTPVEPPLREATDGLDADPLTVVGQWVGLTEHLDDVRRETEKLLGEFGDLGGLTEDQRAAAALAGLYHDVGKAHPVFAASLARAAGDLPAGGPWAKSGRRGVLRHQPPHFRHELVSALMLLEPDSGLLEGVCEPDLVAYLVAAHHGKTRLTIRSAPGESRDLVLGVRPVETTLPVALPDGRHLPALTLRRDVLAVGGDGGEGSGDSWQARACRLRDRADLGPFRVAFLEAVVRVADWRASASYDQETTA